MKQTDIAIIGGGMLGCSAAWFLAKQNIGKVTLFERKTLASAATSRGAGIFCVARPRPGERRMVRDTLRELPILEEVIDDSLGYRRTGSFILSQSDENRTRTRELVFECQEEGDCYYFETPDSVSERCGWVAIDQDHHIAWCPDDGFIDPYRLATGYGQAAKRKGAEIHQDTEVTDVIVDGGKVTGLSTDKGDWTADIVIDAAGSWSALLAKRAGISLPLAPVRSHYWITRSGGVFETEFPVMILADAKAYARYEVGAMLFGIRDTRSAAVSPVKLPADISGFSFDDDHDGWQALASGIGPLTPYCPALNDSPISHYVSGPSAYTPDGAFVMGRTQAAEGFIALGGCCGAGIAHSAGFGRTAAALVSETAPDYDISFYDPDRFGTFDPTTDEFANRCAASRSSKVTA